MGLKINAYIFGVLICGIIIAILGDSDGLGMLIGEAIFSVIILNAIIFVNRKRKLSNHYVILGILEAFLFLFLGNTMGRYITSHCLCIVEIYGIPIEFFEPILVLLTFGIYFYYFFKNSSKNEKIIGALIITLCILSFFERDIRAIYREKFIITSYYSEENGNGLIGYMKDDKKAYLKTRVSNLFSGDYFYTVEVNPNGVDIESFKGYNGLYASDKNFVYFLSEVINADSKTFQVIKSNDSLGYKGLFTDNQTLLNGYAKDKNHVYYFGEVIWQADPNTFEVLGNGYSKDKKHTFYRLKIDDGSKK